VRVLGLNTTDILEGAARAAFRLHGGFREIGVDTELMVQLKLGEHPWIVDPESHTGKAIGIIRRKIEFDRKAAAGRYRNLYEPILSSRDDSSHPQHGLCPDGNNSLHALPGMWKYPMHPCFFPFTTLSHF
jgi:hypothetical protein